jgi:hypothetical protein
LTRWLDKDFEQWTVIELSISRLPMWTFRPMVRVRRDLLCRIVIAIKLSFE